MALGLIGIEQLLGSLSVHGCGKFPSRIDTVGDPGYFTTHAGMRRISYYAPNADPAVIAADEAAEQKMLASRKL